MLFLVFACGCAEEAQNETVDYNQLVQREGMCFRKFSDEPFTGETSGEFEEEVLNGLWQGKVAWFNNGGQLNARFPFKDGLLHGATERMNIIRKLSTHRILILACARRPLRHSPQQGLLKMKISIRKRPAHSGISREFKNENLIAMRTTKRNIVHGPFRDFYPNGQPKTEANYENGKLEGSYISYD